MIGGTTGATNHGIAGLLSPGQVLLHRQEACILEGFSMHVHSTVWWDSMYLESYYGHS